MFKNLNRTFLLISLLLIGTCSSVFAVDFSQTIDQMKQDTSSMGDLFQGKPVVANIYSKALKLAKGREISSTTTSFDHLHKYYSDCLRITDADFINILYNSNVSFKQTFQLLLATWTTAPDAATINKSYSKFFTCKGITTTPTLDQITSLNTEINTIYFEWYNNAYALSTLNQDNFWSDLFRNGTLDDSSFDLLYDINQIGKILFDNFKDSPQILFYRLPKTPVASPQDTNNSSSSSNSDSSNQGWSSGWSSSQPRRSSLWTISSWWIDSSTNPASSDSLSPNQTSSDQNLSSPTNDKDIKNFIDTTNAITPSLPAGSALVFWNQCLVWDTSTPFSDPQDAVPDMTPEAYISGIVDFVNNADINDVIDNALIEKFHIQNPLAPWWSSSDSWYGQSIANKYAEQAFGDGAPWSCEYGCKNLSLTGQVTCQLACAKSCIQKCDGLWIQDKALCVSDCTCFMVSAPNGKGWENVEDMLRIKFCKVPVQTRTVNPWKKVFSIQAIFQEISDVLQWLRDSGQMVKFSKTKEFLDSNVKINLADNFAFKLQIWFKPVFSQKSTLTKTKEEQQANTDLNLGILDLNTSAPEADDYNKYLVISDPVENDASMQSASTLADINSNIDAFAAISESTTKLSHEVIASVIQTKAQWSSIWFTQNMITFLTDNQAFRQNLSDTLLDMNKMALELKTKIENAK